MYALMKSGNLRGIAIPQFIQKALNVIDRFEVVEFLIRTAKGTLSRNEEFLVKDFQLTLHESLGHDPRVPDPLRIGEDLICDGIVCGEEEVEAPFGFGLKVAISESELDVISNTGLLIVGVPTSEEFVVHPVKERMRTTIWVGHCPALLNLLATPGMEIVDNLRKFLRTNAEKMFCSGDGKAGEDRKLHLSHAVVVGVHGTLSNVVHCARGVVLGDLIFRLAIDDGGNDLVDFAPAHEDVIEDGFSCEDGAEPGNDTGLEDP